MGIVEKIIALKMEKQSGIPVEKAVLALLHLIVGKKRISRIEDVTDQGLAVFAGLGKMPDPSFFHEFLDELKTSDAEQFNIICSRRFKEMGVFKGKIINLDRHFMGYFGKKRIGKDKHPTRNISMKGVNASFTHDQETGDPIFVRADYPRLKPEDVAIPMLNTTMDIINNEMEMIVFDKWFSVGSLLNYVNLEMRINYVIQVTYYRYPLELVPLFKDLNEKLKNKGISPAVPWLNNKTLEFNFKL